MSTAALKTYAVQEAAARFDQATRVDRDANIVRDVVILGYESENGRRYTRMAMEAAIGLYDGVPVKIDHPAPEDARKSREFDTTWGWIQNPRVVMENGQPKMRGDVQYLASHASTNTILERIEKHPTKQGLSHNADIDGDWVETVFEVRQITEVRSVDLVENPATTRGIFESRTGGQTVAKTKRRMKLRGILEGADYLPGEAASISGKSVVEMIDDEEMLSTEMDVEDASSPEDGVKSGIRMAIMSVLDDDSLSADEVVNRVRELLAAKEAASGGTATEEEDEEEMAEATESKGRPHKPSKTAHPAKIDIATDKRIAALEQRLEQSEQEKQHAVLESKCRGMLDKAGVEATETRVGAMARCDNDQDRIALLKDWPTRGDAKRPATSPSILESTQDYSGFDYSDPDAMAKALR